MKLGAQLYTIREKCKDTESLNESLGKIAAIGYKYIQLSGFPYDPAAVRARADELGLSIILTHSPADRILNDTDKLIEEHILMGCPNIGIGGFWGDHTPEGARKFLTDLRPAMEKMAAKGLKFQYHNHAFEFERFDGVTLFDILKNESDPELMGFTLDTYWVQYGGVCVTELIKSLKGRINVFHFKDMIMVPEGQHYAPVGEGNLSWNTIVPAFEEIGAEYGFVEQDDSYGRDVFDCMKSSHDFLRSNFKLD